MSEALATRVRNVSRVIYVTIAALVFCSDQLTKQMVREGIPLQSVVTVVPHFFNLTHTENPGAAFGLFSDSPSAWKTAVLILVSAALLVTVIAIVWRSRRLQWETGVGLALILGGAFSNLLDRVRYGHVVDFLDFYFRRYHWFTFNLADTSIVMGAGFLILQVLFAEEHH